MRFSELKENSVQELAIKTASHSDCWGFGSEDEWSFDQDSGLLHFSFSNGKKVTAPAEIVGTYNEVQETWLWAWANSSVVNTTISEATKSYGIEHDLDDLFEPKSEQNLEECWELAAVSMHLANQQGVYKARQGDMHVFFCFGSVSVA